MSDIGEIPGFLRLPQTMPMGVKCYRRRFMSPCTNVATAGPDGYINIFPDTSTPGAFIDPFSTYLMFDFEIINDNPFVDYANFGVEGVGGAIIQDWRVYNQGSITEEILEYGTVAATLGNLEGGYDLETTMYFSNKLNLGYSEEFHKNFIKPPMCDGTGNIMFGPNPFGLGFDSTYGKSAIYTNVGATGINIMSAIKSNYPITTCVNGSESNTITISTFAAGFRPTWQTAVGAGLITTAGVFTPMDWPDLYDPTQSTIVRDYVQEFGSVNKSMVMSNLCNVKCYPIGQKSVNNAYGTSGALTNSVYGITATAAADSAFQTQAKLPPTTTSNTYRICYPPLSGIFGRLAEKALPTCIMSPQQLYINLHLASAQVALQLSSDPCRRVVGTVRDYVRNMGCGNGTVWNHATFTATSTNIFSTSDYAPGYGDFFSLPPTSLPNSIFGTAAVKGSTISSTTYTGGYDGTLVITSSVVQAAAVPASITVGAASIILNDGTVYASLDCLPIGTIIFLKTAGTTAVLVTGVTYSIISKGSVAGVYCLASGVTGEVVRVSALTNTEIAYFRVPSQFRDSFGVIPQECPPAPQYLLCNTPWLFKGTGASTLRLVAMSENKMFYGTYLPFSVPQSARIFSFNKLITGGNITSDLRYAGSSPFTETGGNITYQISNIMLVGDQLILPNSVTDDIIYQAGAGGYNVHTNSVRTTQISLTSGTEQSIICPLKGSMAKKILFVFRNTLQRSQGTGFYYLSNTGFNPFASIYATAGTEMSIRGYSSDITATAPSTTLTDVFGVGFNVPLTYNRCPTSTGTISAQLRIGNEYYPQTALGTMEEISTELVKTMDGWGNKVFTTNVDSRVVIDSTGKTYYDSLQPNKFCTAFINQNLLDDQTITNNYDMAPLYSVVGGVAGVGYASTVLTAATAAGAVNGFNHICPRGFCLNKMFMSPASRFVLAFNLASFAPSERVDGGTYLGNNVITLQLRGAEGLNVPGQTNQVLAIVPHRVIIRFGAGGQMIWNW